MNSIEREPRPSAGPGSRARWEVLVIGAGQAGLAMGRLLSRQGRRFTILESSATVGAAWRSRWESLVLFTPRRYSALPDLAFPGARDGYPTRDEVIAYLERYTATFDLPVELNSPVHSLTASDRGFAVQVDGRCAEADQVVVATGPFQAPARPSFARQLDPGLFQIHSADYRTPSAVPPGRVFVVGGGNTGFQIAKELSRTHRVSLAIGTHQTPLPQRFLGRDLFWWLTRTGLLEKTVDTRIGRRLRERDTLIGSTPRELRRRYGVEVRPRVIGAAGRTLTFADRTTLEADAVVWATGYRPEHPWIELPVFDREGRVRHRRGVTDMPGLYFLGLSWQHTRGSALLGWVKDDAEFIAAQIATRSDARPAERQSSHEGSARARVLGAREEA